MTIADMSGAKFSPCGKYRSLLWRIWDDSLPLLMMLMLNPSKAGGVDSDPTVTRQIERAKRLGCGGLLVANAHDIVSTDPRILKDHPKPISEDCDSEIMLAAERTSASGGFIVCAWGKHCSEQRAWGIVRMLARHKLWCLGLNNDGSPEHPLYKKYDLPLIRYR